MDTMRNVALEFAVGLMILAGLAMFFAQLQGLHQLF
jgi:hypothetical protein